ncbi:DMT family transporter [Nesterenkonia alkaliphila]|uniref:EamA family transporter n=1 Tax=Nesterenkonia alkaliphila TaxID=1463631 RepID=A0A7K1UEI9_9MICC|nr:DMT family transporter [Nesterenkonia alkaliphila]MVT24842.1 EamA family transporter [Nesterenkonia alkaliphila]GFZ92853.1 membrane protein [Nesterenkonia alkaliphila]
MTSPASTVAGTRTLLPAAAILTTVLMWASTFVIMRAAAPEISPGPLALIRLTAGSLTLTLLIGLMRRGRFRIPRGRPLWLTLAFGVSWFAVYTVVFNWAGHYLDAGTVAMVVNFAPLLVGIGAVVFFKEAFSRRLFLGMLISLLGIGLITVAGSTGQLAMVGLLIAFAAALLYAGGMLLQKLALRSVDALTATWLGCAAGTLALLPFLPQTLGELPELSAGTLAGAVYMGIGPSALGFWFWGYAMNHFPTGRVASATLAVPAVVVLMSAVTLNEVPPLLAIIGGAIALAGVAAAQFRLRR